MLVTRAKLTVNIALALAVSSPSLQTWRIWRRCINNASCHNQNTITVYLSFSHATYYFQLQLTGVCHNSTTIGPASPDDTDRNIVNSYLPQETMRT